MKEDAYCEQLCAMNLGRERLELGLSNDMAAATREGYYHDLIVNGNHKKLRRGKGNAAHQQTTNLYT